MRVIHEQVNEKAVTLVIRGSKLTGQMLAKAIRKMQIEMERHKHKGNPTKTYHGKQKVSDLVKQGAGVSNIEINDSNIKSFESVARKYGIDFALKRDDTMIPPKWLVFFKSRDADALNAALKEYTVQILKKTKKVEKPSVLEAIKKMKEVAASRVMDKVKNKEKELER